MNSVALRKGTLTQKRKTLIVSDRIRTKAGIFIRYVAGWRAGSEKKKAELGREILQTAGVRRSDSSIVVNYWTVVVLRLFTSSKKNFPSPVLSLIDSNWQYTRLTNVVIRN